MTRVIVPLVIVLAAVLVIFFSPMYPVKTYYCTALSDDFKFNRVDQTLLWGNDRFACSYEKTPISRDVFFMDYSNHTARLAFANELRFTGACVDLQPEEPSLYTDSTRYSNPPTFWQLATGFFWPEYNAFFEDAQGAQYLCSVFAGTGK